MQSWMQKNEKKTWKKGTVEAKLAWVIIIMNISLVVDDGLCHGSNAGQTYGHPNTKYMYYLRPAAWLI